MPEQVQKILDKVVEWWKQFNTKQKTLLISIAAVILVALGILAAVVSTPQMETLITCASTAEAGEVKSLLESEGISYELSDDGLVFEVKKEDKANASILLGSNEIPTDGYSLEDVFSDGFSATEADKDKKYKLYLQEEFADKLETLSNVERAAVTLDLPRDDGTILSKEEQASVSVILTLSGSMSEEQAAGLAQYLATNVGNEDTSKITILDSDMNVLYSGDDITSVVGNANSQLSLKLKTENSVKSAVKDVMVSSSMYDNVEVAPNLDINFDEISESFHGYSAPEGQTNGMIDSVSRYESESEGGAAATPGTDSNDDTTYVLEDGTITRSTISDETIDYINDETIRTHKKAIGTVNNETSSISVVATNYVKYDEDILKKSGALDDMTFEEYIAANGEKVRTEVDEECYTLVSNATGIPVENITIISYDVPVFEYSMSSGRTFSDYMQIALAVLILLMLGYVVFRSTRKETVEEPEEELSVESLLETTKESQESLLDIGFAEKSETRVLIEKFVEENPEAAAALLRNWLNEDWE